MIHQCFSPNSATITFLPILSSQILACFRGINVTNEILH